MTTTKKSRRRRSERTSASPFFNDNVQIHLTGEGDLIDARFVVDEGMLQPGPVYIRDESTGKIATVLSVPRAGMLMTKRSSVGNVAYAVFINPDDSIKNGSLVTLVVGDYKKEHITVA